MASREKSPLKKPSTQAAKVVIQARIDADLALQVQVLSKEAGDESVSDFFRRAVETEASKGAICLPTAEVTLVDVAKKLVQMHDLLALQEARARTNAALLKSVCQAVGVKPE